MKRPRVDQLNQKGTPNDNRSMTEPLVAKSLLKTESLCLPLLQSVH